MLEAVKTALRIKTDAYNDQLNTLISAAKTDLKIAGVKLPSELDEICKTAIVTYCKIHFPLELGVDFDRLKRSYDEQKAQLSMAEGYTSWQ